MTPAERASLARFQAKLKAMPAAVIAEIKVAMEKSADEIVARMKHLAPVDSGELRDSIGWTWGDAPKYSQRLASIGGGAGGLRITIYAGGRQVPQAIWQEFGTINHPAQPFFRVSWYTGKKRAQSRISRAVNKAVREKWK